MSLRAGGGWGTGRWWPGGGTAFTWAPGVWAPAVWAPGLAMAAAARPVVSGGAGRSTPLSEPELQHLRFLRRLLALPRSTPAATILAEAGQPPLHAHWLRQAARLWNSLVTAPEGSMPRLVVQAAAAVAVDLRRRAATAAALGRPAGAQPPGCGPDV